MDATQACVKPSIPLAELFSKTRNAASARTVFLHWCFSFLTLSLPSQQFIFHFLFSSSLPQQLCSVSFTFMDDSSPMLLTLHSTSTSLRVFLFMSGIFSPILSQLIFMFLSPMRVSSLFCPNCQTLNFAHLLHFSPGCDKLSILSPQTKSTSTCFLFRFALCLVLICSVPSTRQTRQTKKNWQRKCVVAIGQPELRSVHQDRSQTLGSW